MFLARDRREAGASTAEYAGLIVLAALILGVLVPVVATPLRDQLSAALCKIFHPGAAGKCAAPATRQYKPDRCTLSTSTENYDGTLDVEIVEVGKGLSFVRTTTVKNNGDKEVTVTAVDNTKAGVNAGIGVGEHGGKALNAGGDASAAANLKLGIGDSWTFTGKGNEAVNKANSYISDIRKRAVVHSAVGSGNPLAYGADKLLGTDIRNPDIRRYELSVNGSGTVSAGLGLGINGKSSKAPKPPSNQPKSWRKRFNEKHDKRAPYTENYNGNLGGSVSVDASAKAIVERYSSKNPDNPNGSAVTFEVGGNASAKGSYIIGGKKWNGSITGSIKATKDKNGRLISLDLTRTTASAGNSVGKAQTTTTHVPIENDADRRAVASLLGDTASGQVGLNLNWDDFSPATPPGADASPFKKLIYQKGQVTRQDYTYNPQQSSYGGGFKAGPEATGALDFTHSKDDRKLTGSQYLGAPGADGFRHFQNYAECNKNSSGPS